MKTFDRQTCSRVRKIMGSCSSILNERRRFAEEHFKNYQQIGKDSEALEPRIKRYGSRGADRGGRIKRYFE